METAVMSRKSHDDGVVVEIIRHNEGVGDFFSIDVPSSDKKEPYFRRVFPSESEAQIKADSVKQEAGHRCSSRCSLWVRVEASN
jgi:hypothetical protein